MPILKEISKINIAIAIYLLPDHVVLVSLGQKPSTARGDLRNHALYSRIQCRFSTGLTKSFIEKADPRTVV